MIPEFLIVQFVMRVCITSLNINLDGINDRNIGSVPFRHAAFEKMAHDVEHSLLGKVAIIEWRSVRSIL